MISINSSIRDGRASINDQSVLNNRDINPDHRYRLYFVQDSFNDTNSTNDRSSDRVQ